MIVLSFVMIAVPVKLRLNHVLVYSQSVFEGTCSHISLGRHSQITFLRTFGSRRPPTETKRNEMLSSELSACHESISSLKNLNDDLNAKLEEVSKIMSAFRPRGVPGPTSKLSLRAPAQMGWRETEHRGGKPRLHVVLRQSGCACSRGLQAFVRERESLFVSPSSRATTFRTRALALPFIDVRRGSRCTTGV
jgi:hypothetical protein